METLPRRSQTTWTTETTLVCVASVPVRSERNSGHAKESFGPRVKNGVRAKRWKEGGGGGERRETFACKHLDFEKRPLVFTVEFIY